MLYNLYIEFTVLYSFSLETFISIEIPPVTNVLSSLCLNNNFISFVLVAGSGLEEAKVVLQSMRW